MKYSRLRTLLLTCCLGMATASAYARINGYLDTPPVIVPPVINVPQVHSETPLIMRVCPAPEDIEKMRIKYNQGEYADEPEIVMCLKEQGGGAS